MPTIDEAVAGALGASQPKKAAPDPFADAVDSVLGQDQVTRQAALREAVKTDPAAASEAERLAKRYPSPSDVLLRNLQDVKLQAAVDDADALLYKTDVPALKRKMAEVPFARQAHADIKPLAEIESNFLTIGAAGGAQGTLGISESVWRTPQAIERGLGYAASRLEGMGLPWQINPVRGARDFVRLFSEGTLPTEQKFMAGTSDVANRINDATGMLPSVGQPFADLQTAGRNADQALATAIKTGDLSQVGQVLSGPEYWAAFMSQAVPSLYVAMKSGGSVKAMAWLEGMGAANNAAEFEQQTGIRISDTEFVSAVGQVALVNGLLEKYGFDKIFGTGGKGILGIAKAALAEGGTELAQEFNTNLAEWFNYNRDKGLTDNLLSSFMGGTGAGGGIATLRTAQEKVADVIAKREKQTVQAERDLSHLESQMKLAAASMLRENNPETFAQFVQEAATDSGAPTSVFVDGRALSEAFAQIGLTPEQIAEVLPSVPAQLEGAIEANASVEIPVGEALASAPGTPLEQVLLQNARLSPDGLSRVDLEAIKGEAGKFAQVADRIAQQATQTEKVQAEVQTIRENIAGQLKAAGRFSNDVNDGYSRLAGAFYSTMAQRLGVTPSELYARFPLRVTGEQAAGESVGQTQYENDLLSPLGESRMVGSETLLKDYGDVKAFESDYKSATHRSIRFVKYDADGNPIGAIQFRTKGARSKKGEIQNIYTVQSARRTGVASGLLRFAQREFDIKHSNDLTNDGRAFKAADGKFYQSVSTRLPTAKKAIENPLEEMLVIGLDASKADPKAFEKNVELIRQYPNFRDNKSASTPDKAAEQFIKHVVDNLLWLHDNVPQETRQRSKLWYDGARAIVDQWTTKYDITDAQAAGMLAVLSPQKDWFQNVSLAERVLDVMTSKQNFAWSDEMSATAAGIGALNPEDVGEITGKTLGEIESNYLQAMWVRVYDQTYHERGYRVVTPEGDFGGWVTNADGETRSKTAWGSFNEIGKAVAVFKNGSIANISASLGEQHKVRNFYNNIFNPASEHGDVTIDTHAVAAGLLRPLSGSAIEVIHNFGAGGAASSSVFGSKGTYGIYAEAYRRAAAERGILAREMQSITWEAVRGLYTAGFKSQAANVASVDAVWEQYKKRRISLDEARKQLLDLAGGVAAPEWERPGAGASETPWASSYTGELRQGGGVAGTPGSGAGSDGAGGPSTLAQSGDGFAKFVGDATRVDLGDAHEFKAGEPVVVAALHGTTGDFTTFDKSMANIESDLGGGFYFTNNPADVGENYAGMGPDLTNKIQGEAERLESNDDMDSDEAMQIARDRWMANEGLTLPVWVKMTNPAVLGGSNETFLTYEESYDEETDEYGEPTGTLVAVIEALREVAQDDRYGGADIEQTIGELMDRAMDGGLSARELIATAKLSEGLVYATDYESDGKLAPQEILRRAFEAAGFDGFIDQTVDEKFGSSSESQRKYGKGMKGMDADTVHFIAFKPTQIKSRLGNNGNFDETKGSILEQSTLATYSPKDLLIALGPESNYSSFIHELGHFWLDALADMASQPGAPQQIADDFATTMKWFGVDPAAWATMTLDQKRAHHERWAESVEQYIFEGKAPSLELQPLFRRFVSWMKTVYGELKRFIASRSATPGGQAAGDVLAQSGDALAQAAAEGYQGSDAGEAAEWLAAKAKGLDMSEAARMARARALGFDTGKTLYHSTLTDTTEFAPFGKFMGFTGTSGISVTDSSEMASRYLDRYAEFGWVDGKPNQAFSKNVIPVFIKPGKVLERNEPFPLPPGMGLGAPLPGGYVPAHKRMGYDTLVRDDAISRKGVVKHSDAKNAIRGKEYVLTDPSQVRSVFAAFDPDNATSANLLAQGTDPQAGPLGLSDEIRRVMDRLIATDEQIAQAEEVAGMLPEFDATNTAIEKLQARSLANLKWMANARDKYIKALQKEAREKRKDVEAEVTAEVDAAPEMRAKRELDDLRKSTPEYKAALAEWTAARAAEFERAKDALTTQLLTTEAPEAKGLQKGQFLAKNKRRISADAEVQALAWERDNPKPQKALPPDDAMALVADQTGYDSVDAMLTAIDQYGKRADAIEGMTDQRMLERHGDLIDQRAIEEAANDAIHNEARARSLAAELKAQSEAMNPRKDTGQTGARGQRITVNAMAEAMKQFANTLTERVVVGKIRSSIAQHRAAEARAGKAWQEFTAKGDTKEAVQSKRDQALNNYTVRAMLDAQAEAKKVLEFFARVTKGNDEKVVEKGRDPDVVNAMRAILAMYGVAPRLGSGALDYLKRVQENDPAMFAAIEPGVTAAVNNAKPLAELTIGQLRDLHEEMRAMWDLAKRSRQMEVDGNLLDLEDAEAELVERMTEKGIPDRIAGEGQAVTKAEERKISLAFIRAALSRVEQWAERMDGKFGGPFLRFVFQPIKQAADRYRSQRADYRKRFTALVESLNGLMPDGQIDAPELGYKFGSGRDSGVAELLHAILHTGNDSNKRKMLLGREWAQDNGDGTIDTSRWDAFVARMVSEGKLQPQHFDFAQGVWDLLEELKPGAQQAHRTVYGRYFAEVTANEFTDPFGVQRRGGYVPAMIDTRITNDKDIRAAQELENQSMTLAFPSAPKGFTKSRVEYNRPLMLDLRTLAGHMDKVILFTHMQPAVNDVRRLITRKGVAYGLSRIDTAIYKGMLLPWLARSALQTVETPIAGDGGSSRFASALRARAGMALMFGNVSNTLQQITGFTLAGVKVKPALMLKATAAFTVNPSELVGNVLEQSAYMTDRLQNETSAMTDAVNDLLINPNVYEKAQAWTQRHGYFMQTAFDKVMSPIIWTAAYNQALEQNPDHDKAVQFADGVIRQTQGSTLPEDISRFETGTPWIRMFTQFMGYFNMMANTNATAFKQIVDSTGLKKGAGRALYVALLGVFLPIWIAEAIAQAFRGGPDDEDKDGEHLDDWLMAVFGLGTARGLLAQVPLLGMAGQGVLNRFNSNPADDKFSLSPAVSLVESAVSAPFSVYKAIADEGDARKAIRDVASAATLVTGLPFYAAARPAGYVAGVAQDKINPTSFADFARGYVTGTPSPESKQK